MKEIKDSNDYNNINTVGDDITKDSDIEDIVCGSRKIAYAKDKFIMSCVEGNISMRSDEIIYIETMGHRNTIHLSGQDYHIYEKLDTFELILKQHGFLRVHKSYLVNVRHIRNINSYVLTLDNGIRISVPKARYKEVKQEYAAGRIRM